MGCLSCGFDGLREFLDLGQQPLANKYPHEGEFPAERKVPLKAAFCPKCELVQLTQDCLVSRDLLFRDYYYLSSVNPGLVEHFERLAQLIALREPRLVVDIGSNDGILLAPLKELGVQAVGVEPADEIAKIANGKLLMTVNRFWDIDAAEGLEAAYGKADVVVASNIFTHTVDLDSFLKAVDAILSPEGELIIEVEYLPSILRGYGFERFYSDHTFYFTLRSLMNTLWGHGLRVCDAEEIPTHGGSLRVHIQRHGTWEETDAARKRWKDEGTLALGELQTYKNFAHDVEKAAFDFRMVVDQFTREHKVVAGYGAPARLGTITNYAKVGPQFIQYVVDDSPLKQGRYSPGMHIPVVPPSMLTERPCDVLVVFAWNYLDDIKRKLTWLQPKPELLIPIPVKHVEW